MNIKTKVMVTGGVLGALLGVGAAYLYLRSAAVQVDEQGEEQLPAIQPSKALNLGLAVMSLLKLVVGLGRVKQ